MILLPVYTSFIVVIKTCVFSTWDFFSADKIVPQIQIEEQFKKSNMYDGGKALIFASDELPSYALTALHKQ